MITWQRRGINLVAVPIGDLLLAVRVVMVEGGAGRGVQLEAARG